MANSSSSRRSSVKSGYVPTEIKTIEHEDPETGEIFKVKALSKNHVPKFKFVKFYMPKFSAIQKDETVLEAWEDYMKIYAEDLQWLLSVPHHIFWSILIYSKELREEVLPTFLTSAPRFYDPDFQRYQQHPIIGPIYNEIYHLVFRVFLRISVYKESRENFFSIPFWSKHIYDYSLFDIPKIMDLCALYESSGNKTFYKMIENVMKHQPKLVQNVDCIIPMQITKMIELDFDLEDKINHSYTTGSWDQSSYLELLLFRIDMFFSQFKFLKVCPEATKFFHKFQDYELGLAASYEKNIIFWEKVGKQIGGVSELLTYLKTYMINCLRSIIVTPTIYDECFESNKLNEYFTSLTSILHEKRVVHDLELCFPLKNDISNLVGRGIYIDETQFEFLSSAIADCFRELGKEYSLEKIGLDPYYDPTFDRQQLGACSLDMTGIELQSLVTQVKDLLPELPNPYIEACLKHYEYKTENVINALLEGSVPSRLDKYKSEEYLRSSSRQGKLICEPLPVLTNGIKKEEKEKMEEAQFLEKGKEIKNFVLQSLEVEEKKERREYGASSSLYEPSYVGEDLMPSYYKDEDMYSDEYDDSYDGVGIGQLEPDNVMKPLNVKANEIEDQSEEDEEEEKPKKNFDNFVEDPAIIRAQFERRREEKNNQRRPQQAQQPSNRDVVGKAKGQGQDKEVVYNRRQKTQHKDNHKKRSDWKRKEF